MAKSRVRLPADERRAQIVEEATQLIAQQGYYRFSIAGLAERLHLTRAGVLHHIGTKEQLLVDVLDRRDRQIGEQLTGVGAEASALRVRDLLDDAMRQNIAQPELARLYTVLSAESLSADHPAHELFLERLHRSEAALAPLLNGFDRGGSEVAVEILSFMDGLQASWLRDPSIDIWARWTSYADSLFQTRMPSMSAASVSPMSAAMSRRDPSL